MSNKFKIVIINLFILIVFFTISFVFIFSRFTNINLRIKYNRELNQTSGSVVNKIIKSLNFTKIKNKEFKKNNWGFSRVFNNNLYKLIRKNTVFVFFLLTYTLILFVLSILLLKRMEKAKIRKKSFLFMESLLEEMIETGNINELKEAYKKIKIRQKASQNLTKDFRSRYNSTWEGADFYRMEILLEKFIDKIAEKGIQFGSSIPNIENVDVDNKSYFFTIKNDDEAKKSFERKEIVETNEAIEELESVENKENFTGVPKISSKIYEENMIEDDLAREIKEISQEKTPLQKLLNDIYGVIGADKLFLLVNTQKQYSYMQIYQAGIDSFNVQKVNLDEDDRIIQHLFANRRMIYINDIEKINIVLQNDDFKKQYQNMKSLFIFPVVQFEKIRALILLFFNEDIKDRLNLLMDLFEKNGKELRKNILKLV